MLSQERALPPFPHQARCGQTSCGQGQGPGGLRTRAGLGHSWPQTHQPWPVLASGARLSPSHPPGLGVYRSGGPLPSHCPESPWGHPAGTRVDLPLKLWCAQQRGLVHGWVHAAEPRCGPQHRIQVRTPDTRTEHRGVSLHPPARRLHLSSPVPRPSTPMSSLGYFSSPAPNTFVSCPPPSRT